MGTEHMFNIFNELPMNYFVGFVFKYWQISWKMSKYLICFFFSILGLKSVDLLGLLAPVSHI